MAKGETRQRPFRERAETATSSHQVRHNVVAIGKRSQKLSRTGWSRIADLNIASYELAEGEQVALIGPSGGGKTTLLNVISGILVTDTGRSGWRGWT